MKLWKHSLITAFAFIGISTTVVYTSCEKDSCLDLKCKNGGSCADGFCRCQTGFEGTECEIKAATKFLGRFIGNYTCPNTTPLKDTVDIWLQQDPNKVKFVEHSRITDTLSGTVTGINLTFSEQSSGVYRKYTTAEVLSNKLTVFVDEIYDVNTGARKACSFIGYK
jgi:hypothetical protein